MDAGGLLDSNLKAHQESLGSFPFVNLNLVNKELVLLDKLLLQARETIFQTSRMLGALLSFMTSYRR